MDYLNLHKMQEQNKNMFDNIQNQMKLLNTFNIVRMCKVKKNIDYSNSKIYKIQKIDGTVDDDVYIGSTCKSLNERMSVHKCNYKRYRYSYIVTDIS